MCKSSFGRIVTVLTFIATACGVWTIHNHCENTRIAIGDIIALGGVLNEGEYGEANIRGEMGFERQDPSQHLFGMWSAPIRRIDIVWNAREPSRKSDRTPRFANALEHFRQLRTLFVMGDRADELLFGIPIMNSVREVSVDAVSMNDEELSRLLAAFPLLETCTIEDIPKQVNSLNAVNRLSKLRMLSLSFNEPSQIVSTLESKLLAKLRHLTMRYAEIPREVVQRCNHVSSLDVWNSVVIGGSSGSPMKLDRLRSLTCGGDDPSSVSGFLSLIQASNVRQMQISVHRMTDDDIKQVLRFGSVEELSLSATAITSEQFSRLLESRSLRHVTLEHMDCAFLKHVDEDKYLRRVVVKVVPTIGL